MPKTLMLMRHGQYTSGETLLNTVGHEQVDDVAAQLAAAGLVPDVILHSPTPRAAETASRVRDVFNRVCGIDVPMQARSGLSVESKTCPVDITGALDSNVQTALVVSHQPNIYCVMKEIFGKVAPPHHAEAYVLEGDTAGWPGFHGRMAADFRPKILSL